MRKVSVGFSVIEFLVYFSCFTFLITLVFAFTTSSHKTLFSHSSQANVLAGLFAARQVFVRDLYGAQTVKQCGDAEIIFSVGDNDIGWILEKNKLFRIAGNFDGQVWRKKTKNCAATHVNDFGIEVERSAGGIKCFDYHLESLIGKKPYRIQGVVRARNGVLT